MHESDHDDEDDGALLDRVGLVRGLLVVVTAIALGAFLLTQGPDGSGVEVAAGSGDGRLVDGDDPSGATGSSTASSTSLRAAAGDDSDDTTTTTARAVTSSETTATETSAVEATTTAATSGVPPSPGDVTVLVLNGAGTRGIAADGVSRLDAEGYDTLEPKNASALGPSLVLYGDGSETAAVQVAAVFGVDASLVAPLDPASPPVDDTQGADVIVVIGQDGLIDP